jgi:hypothetical protein
MVSQVSSSAVFGRVVIVVFDIDRVTRSRRCAGPLMLRILRLLRCHLFWSQCRLTLATLQGFRQSASDVLRNRSGESPILSPPGFRVGLF